MNEARGAGWHWLDAGLDAGTGSMPGPLPAQFRLMKSGSGPPLVRTGASGVSMRMPVLPILIGGGR